jgi:hypothetical protein
MGLTLDDCKRLGIPLELHPATSGRSERAVLRERFGIDPGLPAWAAESEMRGRAPEDRMNKTERAFAEVLAHAFREGMIYWWDREAIKLRLAGRTWYTPDFTVNCPHAPELYMIEVKGFMRDDAAVKLKVAAGIHDCFRWLLVRRDGRHGWDIREVNSRGIGTSPVRVPWIHGG